MHRLVSVTLLAALAACAQSPAPGMPQTGTVSYQLRDHTGIAAAQTAPRTGVQPIYYTTHHVHPEGLSDPVSDRAAALWFGWGTGTVAQDPDSFPPKR